MLSLSVFFDDPFWVGVLELVRDGELRAVRIVFGAEPTDPELYAFLMRNGTALLEQVAAAEPVAVDARRTRRPSPKRAAKLAAREAAKVARRGTASQEALRLEYENRKKSAAESRRARREAEEAHRREVARRKRIARKRGR